VIQAVKLRQFLPWNLRLGTDGPHEPGGERCVEAFEELQKEHAEAVALREQPIPPRMRKLVDQPLGAQFGDVVAERRQPVVGGGLPRAVATGS